MLFLALHGLLVLSPKTLSENYILPSLLLQGFTDLLLMGYMLSEVKRASLVILTLNTFI